MTVVKTVMNNLIKTIGFDFKTLKIEIFIKCKQKINCFSKTIDERINICKWLTKQV